MPSTMVSLNTIDCSAHWWSINLSLLIDWNTHTHTLWWQTAKAARTQLVFMWMFSGDCALLCCAIICMDIVWNTWCSCIASSLHFSLLSCSLICSSSTDTRVTVFLHQPVTLSTLDAHTMYAIWLGGIVDRGYTSGKNSSSIYNERHWGAKPSAQQWMWLYLCVSLSHEQ